jgi:lysozyme family protein
MSDLESTAWTEEDRIGSANLEAIEETPELESAEKAGAEGLEAATGNKSVSRSINPSEIKPEYADLFAHMEIRPEKVGTPGNPDSIEWYTRRIASGKSRYETISQQTGVPWHVIGIIHGLECSFNFQQHLFNGDSLKDYTHHWPPGYPKDKGNPPFTFEDSAVSALNYDKIAQNKDWTLAAQLYELERYNGFGYRQRLAMASPYLWSFSNYYVKGKFKEILVGGRYRAVYDPNLVSKQCGAAVILKQLTLDGLVELGGASA